MNSSTCLRIFYIFSLLFPLCLNTEAQPQISGPLTGEIGPGTFSVTGDIYIPANRALTINAGTTFIFQSGVEFLIYPNAAIFARGTSTDSIKFINQTGSYWDGLFLSESNDASTFRYCLITGSNITGIVFYDCNPTMEHCSVTGNLSVEYGGGILCWEQACPTISHCLISDNSAWRGGGIRLSEGSNAFVTDCIISENLASAQGGGISVHISNPIFRHCKIEGNISNYEGGGAYYYGQNMLFDSCYFRGNQAEKGGAIFCWGGSPLVYHSVFQNNRANYGGGFYCQDGSNGEIMNNIFYHNQATINGGAIRIENSDPTILNNIITGSSCDAVYFTNCPNATLDYCNIYRNSDNNFTGSVPPRLGIISAININGDSCDFYHNIFLNPQFVNPTANNFKLQAISPGIDAGSPLSPPDPDSTIADIGAFYYPQDFYYRTSNSLFATETLNPLPSSLPLIQISPNPFNSALTIRFELREAHEVDLSIYDVCGREIGTLDTRRLTLGMNTIMWKAEDLPAGVYFIWLSANSRQPSAVNGQSIVRKVVLMK
jgi:predicted outer membrane repeat protein